MPPASSRTWIAASRCQVGGSVAPPPSTTWSSPGLSAVRGRCCHASFRWTARGWSLTTSSSLCNALQAHRVTRHRHVSCRQDTTDAVVAASVAGVRRSCRSRAHASRGGHARGALLAFSSRAAARWPWRRRGGDRLISLLNDAANEAVDASSRSQERRVLSRGRGGDGVDGLRQQRTAKDSPTAVAITITNATPTQAPPPPYEGGCSSWKQR